MCGRINADWAYKFSLVSVFSTLYNIPSDIFLIFIYLSLSFSQSLLFVVLNHRKSPIYVISDLI